MMNILEKRSITPLNVDLRSVDFGNPSESTQRPLPGGSSSPFLGKFRVRYQDRIPFLKLLGATGAIGNLGCPPPFSPQVLKHQPAHKLPISKLLLSEVTHSHKFGLVSGKELPL